MNGCIYGNYTQRVTLAIFMARVALLSVCFLAVVGTPSAASNPGTVENTGQLLHYGDLRSSSPSDRMFIVSAPNGGGYWIATQEGVVSVFGDAGSYGDLSEISLNKPIVGMRSTPSGLGYWLVASDGGIFTFGDAQFFGSTGAMTLNKPIVGMGSTLSGLGYWLVASDGGIFTFGDAQFFGSAPGQNSNSDFIEILTSRVTSGYALVSAAGEVLNFGDMELQGRNSCSLAPVGSASSSAGGVFLLRVNSQPETGPITAKSGPLDSEFIDNLLDHAQQCETDSGDLAGFLSPVADARITSSFGLRNHPIWKQPLLHGGTDYVSTSKSYDGAINAAKTGTVIAVFDFVAYGRTVVLGHGNKLATVYAHLKNSEVSVGEIVEIGQAIGQMGSTGASTGAHLHFEIRVSGLVRNPVPLLAQ
jgi:murein DD-endopeptidase MepM/ murein hydrolase activator NlpD